MLGRLLYGIHWVLFLWFVGMWGLIILELVIEGNTKPREVIEPLEVIERGLGFRRGLDDFLYASSLTWIPPLFLFIDYVVNGKWTWFPWERNKD